MRPFPLLLSLLLIAPAFVRAQQDDLEKLRAARKAEILTVADNPSLTLDQKKEIIKGIRKGYSKRIRALQGSAPSAPVPTIAGPAPADDQRAQLRAQRKAEILVVANDGSLTLDQKKEKIAAIRANYRERFKNPNAPTPAPAPAPSRPPSRTQSRRLDDELLP